MQLKMTSLLSKADDLTSENESEEEDTRCYSDVSSEGPSDVTASNSVESEEEGAVTSVQSSSSQGGGETKKVDAGNDIEKGRKQ